MAKKESVFTDQDLTLENYRMFSPSSLFAFIFSVIVSFIAFVNPAANLITILAVGFAIYSIYRVIAARGRSSGQILSALALILPLFVLASTARYQQLRLQHLTNVAVQHSETWLKLLQEGKAVEAHELTLTRYQREPSGMDLTVARGSIENPKSKLAMYLKNNLDTSILEDGEQAELTRIGRVDFFKERNLPIENFIIHYKYERPNGEERKFDLQMRRQKYRSGEVAWNVMPYSVEPREQRSIELDE